MSVTLWFRLACENYYIAKYDTSADTAAALAVVMDCIYNAASTAKIDPRRIRKALVKRSSIYASLRNQGYSEEVAFDAAHKRVPPPPIFYTEGSDPEAAV